ncbi:hypothetical protein B0H17DRAFT_1211796 [Mycena rosella]|uniref:Uncharacterized protein n=1 Tax=Mycena rosella TaxID=1033263 RepID=A0AAD7CT83_MYCRO|nr:hypothetical protein B0H17DRAFT_1211796 [Mycena rosella]
MRVVDVYTIVPICIWFLARGVHGHVPRETSKASSTDIASSPPSFSFNTILEMTTCVPATITYLYDSSANFTLSITNNGVSQPPPPSATTTGNFTIASNVVRSWNRHPISRRGALSQSITSSTIDSSLHSYIWASVDVPEAWYILVASLSFTTPIESVPFFVRNGTYTSRIRATSMSSSASDSNSINQTILSEPGSSSVSGIPPPQAHTSKINRGAIAGGVAGGLVLLIAGIALLLRFRRSRIASTPANIPPPSSTSMPPVMLLPLNHGETVLAFDRPIVPGVIDSPEAMLDKLARMPIPPISHRLPRYRP